MRTKSALSLFILLILFSAKTTFALKKDSDYIVLPQIEKQDSDSTKVKSERRKKAITAALAFPLPLGFVGAHRAVLGTKPWVPIVYVVTLGGGFGILPLIDFIVILSSKNNEKLINNPRVVMWIK